MHTFTDGAGREWPITINLGTMMRLKDEAQIDLLDLVRTPEGSDVPPLFARLEDDVPFLATLLWQLLRPEADKRGITNAQFWEGLAGDPIGAAVDALLEELADFFRSGKRQVLKKAFARWKDLQQKGEALATARIDSPEMDRLLDDALRAIRGT